MDEVLTIIGDRGEIRIARKDTRTMSDLVRDTLNRPAQSSDVVDVREYVRQIAPTPPAFQAIRAEAKRKGTDKLTMAQIDREVAADTPPTFPQEED
jgi:hypothetical protein